VRFHSVAIARMTFVFYKLQCRPLTVPIASNTDRFCIEMSSCVLYRRGSY